MRHYSKIDNLINRVDQTLKALVNKNQTMDIDSPEIIRKEPGSNLAEANLTAAEKKHAGSLMRINHTGEVCAQALYLGQAITARDKNVVESMQQAAKEENDHLLWCENRIKALGTHTSYLNPLWYMGSLTMGILAGLAGDKWNLGFVAETERQVVKHLDKHQQTLPVNDKKSHAVIAQMKIDEAHHETQAIDCGAVMLPPPIKFGMQVCSKVMTGVVYYV